MAILDQKQKKNLVFKCLQDDYSYREIQKRCHVSPAFIPKVKKELLERTLFLQINLQKSQKIPKRSI